MLRWHIPTCCSVCDAFGPGGGRVDRQNVRKRSALVFAINCVAIAAMLVAATTIEDSLLQAVLIVLAVISFVASVFFVSSEWRRSP